MLFKVFEVYCLRTSRGWACGIRYDIAGGKRTLKKGFETEKPGWVWIYSQVKELRGKSAAKVVKLNRKGR